MRTIKCQLVKHPIPYFKKICGTFMDILKPNYIRKKNLVKTLGQQILMAVFHIEFKQI
jgi:hypothetical protein